jgi:hypothetical protein
MITVGTLPREAMTPRMTTSPQRVTLLRMASWPSARMVTSPNLGDFAKEGNVAITSTSAKRELLLTKEISIMDCSFTNWDEVAKDGNLAIDGNLAEVKQLIPGRQRCHKRQLYWERMFAFTMATDLAEVGQHCQEGSFATKSACSKGGGIAKDGKLRRGLQLHQGG